MASVSLCHGNPNLVATLIFGDEYRLPSPAYISTAITASAAMLPSACWSALVTNTGAAGTVVLSLPPGQLGMSFVAQTNAAQILTINPDDAEYIISDAGSMGSAGGAASCVAAVGQSARFLFIGDGHWHMHNAVGTWTIA